MFPNARILIIDDTPDNITLMQAILASADFCCVRGESDPSLIFPTIRNWKPDLIILDLMMPVVSGFDVLRALPDLLPCGAYLPVLVVTSNATLSAREEALFLGASDFLSRPHQAFDVLLRARNLLQTRKLYLELEARNRTLEAEVLARTLHLEEIQEELKATQLEVIERLALAGEHHDDDTGAHTRRVALSCRRIAQGLKLPDDQVERVFRAAPLHDVGKIGVSDAILLKPGKLTPDEFDTMKRHCEIGGQLLSNGHSDFLATARTIALSHHERFDGTGYPFRLAGEDIPLEGRIVAVADVFDALTNERPYKKAWPVEEAKSEIEKQAGRQFDPKVVEAFLSL